MADSHDTFQIIMDLLGAGLSPLVTGPPGVGKTGFIYDLAGTKINGQEVKILSMVASNRESTDIGGYPTVVDGVVKFVPVDWAVSARELFDQGYFVIVFIDEVRDITPPVFAALNKVVHERKVGDFEMPFGVRFIGAANSIEDSTVGIAMPPPSANRWCHIPWEINTMVGSWIDNMILNRFALQSPLTAAAKDRLPAERANIAAFIQKRQELIHVMPKSEDEKDGPWPSPRTLDYTAHAWAAVDSNDLERRMRLMASCVGKYVAAEYLEWRRSANLPDPELVLKGEIKDFVVNDRPDITYSTLSSVVSCVASRWSKDRYLGAWKVIAIAADAGAADIATALVPTLERTTDGRTDVPDPSEHIKSLLPILQRAGVSLR